jgi:hypothetical protein
MATDHDDSRFVAGAAAVTAIVTSSAQQDSGMFETNLRDERYLPFEGAGAISSWKLSLPKSYRAFDYDSISDVVIHLRYTARDGGEALKTRCLQSLDDALGAIKEETGTEGLMRLFSLRHEFPTEWYRFVRPAADATGDQRMTIVLDRERFSALFRDSAVEIKGMHVFAQVNEAFSETLNEDLLNLSLNAGSVANATPLKFDQDWNGLIRYVEAPGGALGPWTLAGWVVGTPHQRIDPGALDDIVLVCRFSIKTPT